MSTSLRRNACPSLAAPMQTGDGLLARINTVTGAISPRDLALVASAATRHGNGIVEVTRRGSLQIRGLTAASAELFSHEILTGGIDVRSGVPVETGPLAGLDPEEIIDPRSIVTQIAEMTERTDLPARLGPKVSVVVDGSGQLSMDDVMGDVRLTAVRDDGLRWQVSVGGTAARARIVASMEGETAAALAIELLGAIAARGRTGRGKDLSEQEISKAYGSKAGLDWQRSCPARPTSKRSAVGEFVLAGAHLALGLGLPFGQATASQLSMLAQTAEESGISEFRLAPGHALLAICDHAAQAENMRRAAAASSFVVDPADPRLKIVACAGAPSCASGLIQTKEIAARIAAGGGLPQNGLVHVSGCAKRCAEPAAPSFTILGTPEGASILDGETGKELDLVAEREVAAAFQRVVGSRGMGRDRNSASPLRHGKSA